MQYNSMELMIILAARLLEDNKIVVVGTGAPCAAAMLAQLTHAPHLTVMFEAGGIGPLLPSMPISVGDSRTFHRAIQASSMLEVMEAAQRGWADYAFLGGAQIDPYGNLNSTVIGDYRQPQVRFPGSGGANDLGSLCWRIITIMPQDRQRFVEKCDFITTPGYLTGPGAREAVGLPPGTGPYKVITDLGVLGYDPETLRMQVESLHPGVSREEMREKAGFELLWADQVIESEPPAEEELRLLREVVDPYRYIIGRA